jgi:hypothetical protein
MDDLLLTLLFILTTYLIQLIYIYFERRRQPRPFLVALHGPVGSGKDTAAKCIPHNHEFAFAEPLKSAAMILFGFTHEQVYDQVQKEIVDERWGASPRQIMQWLSTDILRGRWPDMFIRRMDMKVKDAIEWGEANGIPPRIVITDCRFPNEAEYIHNLSFEGRVMVVKIVREGEARTEHHNHASEQPLPDEMVDYVLENKGTLEEYRETVRRFHAEHLST